MTLLTSTTRPRRHQRIFIGAAVAAGAFSVAPAVPAEAATPPAVWVGSPVTGTWGLRGQPSTTPSGSHHTLVKANPRNDWSVDLTGTAAASTARLYVAPSNSAYNTRVTTVISQIIDNNACRAGGGGDLVTVSIRFDGTPIGQVTFAHLDRSPALRVGQTVSRWGTEIGKVANLTGTATGGGNCWTGPHVHTELRASTRYACWNRGLTAGQAVRPSNFIGFVSGSPLATTTKACP